MTHCTVDTRGSQPTKRSVLPCMQEDPHFAKGCMVSLGMKTLHLSRQSHESALVSPRHESSSGDLGEDASSQDQNRTDWRTINGQPYSGKGGVCYYAPAKLPQRCHLCVEQIRERGQLFRMFEAASPY